MTPNGVDPIFAPGSGTHDYVLVGRSDPATEEPARGSGGRARQRASRSSSSGRRRTRRSRMSCVGVARRLEGYVGTDRLAELYRGAACLVQSSRYEGFGLPVLEAMASGTPVVAVPDPALREVAGDAAIFVEEAELGRRDPARRSPSASDLSRQGSSVRAPSAGARLRNGRSPCTGRYSRREGLGSRRLARPRGRARALAARARAAGRRDGRDREPSGLGRRPAGGRARHREPASAAPSRPTSTSGSRPPRVSTCSPRIRTRSQSTDAVTSARRLRRRASTVRNRGPADALAGRNVAAVAPPVPDRPRDDRPAHAAPPLPTSVRDAARALRARRAPDRAGPGGLDARRLPAHAPDDARRDRRLGRRATATTARTSTSATARRRRGGSGGTCPTPSSRTRTRP